MAFFTLCFAEFRRGKHCTHTCGYWDNVERAKKLRVQLHAVVERRSRDSGEVVAKGFTARDVSASAQNYGTGSNPSDHYVQGHTSSSGTYVAPHYQTNPNGNPSDNYGAQGNYNPHNGQTGRGY
jgi:hypothetical protein